MVIMESRKSVHEIQNLASIIKIEDEDTINRKKASGKNTKTKQKSKIEKAFAIEEKGMKNAFKLF
jgi:4-diphosphocytidyl-2C-methyl-D-erythritol kinase